MEFCSKSGKEKTTSQPAAAHVARSDPAGHAILRGGSFTHALNPAKYRRLPFEPINSFASVTRVNRPPQIRAGALKALSLSMRLPSPVIPDMQGSEATRCPRLNLPAGGGVWAAVRPGACHAKALHVRKRRRCFVDPRLLQATAPLRKRGLGRGCAPLGAIVSQYR